VNLASASIDVESLQRRLARHEPTFVLDVRPAAERLEWSIPGSVHIDAYQALRDGDPDALAGIRPPAGQLVVAVCGAGKTSLIAVDQLRQRGIEAQSLEGGMKAWSLAWNAAEVPLARGDVSVVQVRRTGKGCLSYVVGSGEQAAVVDASLPAEVYRELAREHGWKIAAVLETHVHADHLSRARQLAEMCGARLYLPRQQRTSFHAEWIDDASHVQIGTASIEALRTPGHTFESTCYRVAGSALITGDTLFLNSVGRPDLEAKTGEARERASLLHRSLLRLMELPEDTIVLPGHTSVPVSFDGRPVMATLERVRTNVPLLGLGEEEFVAAILARIPPTPPNHAEIVRLNEAGIAPAGDATDLEAGANRCAVM
jgi:glyoxylase-like metal-dependent hydrolase (beta-lactamase superfamily II)